MTKATHTVAFEPEGSRPNFVCHGDRDSDCHSYPDCDCESWGDDHEHPFVPHDECWMQGWFDNNAIEYLGVDGDVRNYGYEPPAHRSGKITANFEGDYIEWDWAS